MPRVPVGVEVMTGACVSMSLMKSLVIRSNSSTSLIFRGTPPPGTGTGPGADGCVHTRTDGQIEPGLHKKWKTY